MNMILRDIDDQAPNVAQLETSADIGTMIGQAISGLFGAITNLISGGLGTAEDSALREELEKTQQELKTWRMITIGVIVVDMFEYSAFTGSVYGGGGKTKKTKTLKKTRIKVRKQYKEPYVNPFVPAPEAAMIDLQSLINVAHADITSALQGALPKTMPEIREEAKHLGTRVRAQKTIERAIVEPLLKGKRPSEPTKEEIQAVRESIRALKTIPKTEYEITGQKQIKETLKLLEKMERESMRPMGEIAVTEPTVPSVAPSPPITPGGPKPIVRYEPIPTYIPYYISGYDEDITTGEEPAWWETIDWWKVAIFGGLALIVIIALFKGRKKK